MRRMMRTMMVMMMRRMRMRMMMMTMSWMTHRCCKTMFVHNCQLWTWCRIIWLRAVKKIKSMMQLSNAVLICWELHLHLSWTTDCGCLLFLKLASDALIIHDTNPTPWWMCLSLNAPRHHIHVSVALSPTPPPPPPPTHTHTYTHTHTRTRTRTRAHTHTYRNTHTHTKQINKQWKYKSGACYDTFMLTIV